MPKLTVYLRIGKRETGGYGIAANTSPNPNPLKDNSGRAIPTVSFGLKVAIPDSAFTPQVVAEIDVPEEALRIIQLEDVQVDDAEARDED